MNKRLKHAFIYALIIAGSFNLGGYLVNIGLESLEDAIANFKEIGIFTIALFFVPCFISVLNFKEFNKDNLKRGLVSILITILLSFVIMYIVVWLHFFRDKTPFVYINDTLMANSIIASLISIPSYLIYYLLNKKSKSRFSIKNLPFKNGIIAWVIITVLYFTVFSSFTDRLSGTKVVFICIAGLLASVFIYIAFILSYRKNYNIYIVFSIAYVINVLILPYIAIELSTYMIFERLNYTMFESSTNGDRIDIIGRVLVALVLISPYLLTISLFTHANYIYFNNKAEKENLKQIGIEASLKYQQLKAQIAPHFLFNNISVLTGLIEENQEKAVLFSENLAVIYRYFLDQEIKDLATLKEELSFANTYLNLLKVRFENALVVNNTINTTEHFYILPMALQQILENIIKHNVLSRETPIKIDLSVEKAYIVISNTRAPKGIFNANNPSGLDNIKQRYAYFTDKEIIIKEDDTHFTIKLPLLNPEL